jgi:two-component sensor histidine kinase
MRRRQLEQADEVILSRSRLQAAADEESRKLERQLDQSVMSRLTTMRELVVGTPYAGLVTRFDEVRDELLRHARGLDPLAGRTLAQAPAAHVERGVTVSVDPAITDPSVARTAWYVATEALTNAAKHAPGTTVTLSVRSAPGGVDVVVTDKGPGGADPSGAGLVGLADRVEAAGGTFELTSTVAGTKVAVRLPRTGKPLPEQGSPGFADASGFLGSRT